MDFWKSKRNMCWKYMDKYKISMIRRTSEDQECKWSTKWML